MPILVTGSAGFIGYHLAERLLTDGEDVVGVDRVDDYYDPALKEARLARLRRHGGFAEHRIDIGDRAAMASLFAEHRPTRVVHLAGQAGVRHSLKQPHDYVESNVSGFLHVLEGCRHHGVEHLLYASSSSVYGLNQAMPSSEHHPVDHPVSLYAATKRANELMAHSYSHLFGLPTTGLRFFTVYGPWGRPDMALFAFTRAMLAGEPIDVYNHGDMERDFTYVDDVIDGVLRLIPRAPVPSGQAPTGPASSSAPFAVYNLGGRTPERLLHMIELLEQALGVEADKRLLPMQPGDVRRTSADVSELQRAVGWAPSTPLAVGIRRFVDWYRSYYGRDGAWLDPRR